MDKKYITIAVNPKILELVGRPTTSQAQCVKQNPKIYNIGFRDRQLVVRTLFQEVRKMTSVRQ